jgi:L-lysine 2,3-aminomutase
MFDPVQGVAHFDICEEKAKIIVQKMMATLPGFLMPKLVREIAGEANKTPINLA